MLKPSNIKGKSFGTEKNGYSRQEVDEFLSKVAEDYTEVLNANEESESKILKLVEKVNEYREDEEAISSSLVTAQREANKILNEAKAKAKDMVENAKTEQIRLAEQSEAECEKIVKQHKERCAELIRQNTEETEMKIQAVKKAYDDEKTAFENLKKEVALFKAQLTELYQKQIRLVLELPEFTPEEPENTANEETTSEVTEETKEETADTTAENDEVETKLEEIPEENIKAAEEESEHIEKILNTASFEPVIPKESFNDLKFGKNN